MTPEKLPNGVLIRSVYRMFFQNAPQLQISAVKPFHNQSIKRADSADIRTKLPPIFVLDGLSSDPAALSYSLRRRYPRITKLRERRLAPDLRNGFLHHLKNL